MAWSRDTDWSDYYRLPSGFAERYLQRLGVERRPVSRAFLDALIRAHLLAIPFENLDTTDLGHPVHLEPERLMDKLLLRRRGGFCFELNGAFQLLLVALGFDAWLCPCRQMRHQEPCPVPATHCAILVHLAGETLFCDVGYGGPVPRDSLLFQPDLPQQRAEGTFLFRASGIVPTDPRSRAENSGWYTLIRRSARSGKELPLMQLAPIACYLCDFYGQSLLRSEGPTAYSLRHVTRMLPDGFVDLTGHALVVAAGGRQRREVVPDTALNDCLRHWFGIELDADDAQKLAAKGVDA